MSVAGRDAVEITGATANSTSHEYVVVPGESVVFHITPIPLSTVGLASIAVAPVQKSPPAAMDPVPSLGVALLHPFERNGHVYRLET